MVNRVQSTKLEYDRFSNMVLIVYDFSISFQRISTLDVRLSIAFINSLIFQIDSQVIRSSRFRIECSVLEFNVIDESKLVEIISNSTAILKSPTI